MKRYPKKVAILGLDLSAKPTVTGWFLVAMTAYFFLLTMTFGALDIRTYKQPARVRRLSKNVTGDTLGLTEDECLQENNQPYRLDEGEVGTSRQEIQDIQRQKSEISNNLKSSDQASYDRLIIVVDNVCPFVFMR